MLRTYSLKTVFIFGLLFAASSGLTALANPDSEFIFGSGEIVDAAYSPDGQFIATLGSLGVQIWNVETMVVYVSYPSLTRMNELKWSPNSLRLFVTDIQNLYGSFVIDLESNSVIEIPSEIRWHFRGRKGEFEIPTHNNSVNFSRDESELIVMTPDNQVAIYSLTNGDLVTQINGIDDQIAGLNKELSATGFFENNHEIWYSTREIDHTKYPYIRSNKIFKYNRDLEEISLWYLATDDNYIPSFGDLNTLFDITNDSRFILESDYFSPSIGFYSSYTSVVDSTSNVSWEIIKNGALFSGNSYVSFYPNRIQYQPGQNRFISLAPYDTTSSFIVIADISEQRKQRMTVFDVNSMFTQPFNEDASSFLVSDFVPLQPDTPDLGGFGPVIPNYDLYEINWEALNYEHILPRTAPELIAFQPGETAHLFTHTNRISKQYLYTEALQDQDSFPDKELSLIANQFSQPVSRLWSMTDRSMTDEITNKPLYAIGDFSLDGMWFASPASADGGQINIWETGTWQPIHELVASSSQSINSLCFSDGGEWLAAAHQAIDIWNVSTGNQIAHLICEATQINHAAFSNDSSQLLAAGNNGRVLEWNIQTQTNREIISDVSPVIYVTYLENPSSILYVLNDGTAKVYNLQTQELEYALDSSLGTNSFRSVKYLKDQQILFTGNEVWNLTQKAKVNTIANDRKPVLDLQISDDGHWLATRHSDYTARVWPMDAVLNQQSSVNQFEKF